MTLSQVTQLYEDKVPYLGAGCGGLCAMIANATGLTGSADKVLVVALCTMLGGMAANFPKVLALFFKKRMDDNVFFASYYQSVITDLRATNDKHEKVVQAHVDCRHDFQRELNGAYLRLDYLNELLEERGIETGPKIKRFDGDARLKQLDNELREIKGMKPL